MLDEGGKGRRNNTEREKEKEGMEVGKRRRVGERKGGRRGRERMRGREGKEKQKERKVV